MKFRETFPELAGELGFFPTGPLNAITDVPGVRVGHATVHNEAKGYFSGVTAIWPRSDVYEFRPRASGHVLHGAGEMTGLHQILEWGLIETPILLTSTLNVGRVYGSTIEYLARQNPKMGISEDVLIPVVAECDDSQLSHAREQPVTREHVFEALDAAVSQTGSAAAGVVEGSVGAGTGMITFDFKGGIGTSSRKIKVGEKSEAHEFTLGILVNANFGFRRQLRVAGHPVGRKLQDRFLPKTSPAKPNPERSVIVIIATDAPMRPDQLRRVSMRAGFGLGRVGSFAGHGSGEIILAFTTSLGETRGDAAILRDTPVLNDGCLNSFYEAVVECVEESVLNALSASSRLSHSPGGSKDGIFTGRDGNQVYGLPIEEIKKILNL